MGSHTLDLEELLQLKTMYERKRDDALKILQDYVQTVKEGNPIHEPCWEYNKYCDICRYLEIGNRTIAEGGKFRMEVKFTNEPKRVK
jgi:hypothetical protein